MSFDTGENKNDDIKKLHIFQCNKFYIKITFHGKCVHKLQSNYIHGSTEKKHTREHSMKLNNIIQ